MRYRYEFELSNFEKGFCADCPLSYYNGYYYICPLGCDYKNCPLEEVKNEWIKQKEISSQSNQSV